MADYPAQLAAESAQAYEAACAYFSMGADRSMDAVAKRLSKSSQLMKRWSALHSWVDRSREYDTALTKEAAAAHTTRYLADLEDHRKRSSEAGKALYQVAGVLLRRLNEQAGREPKRIEGKDGKWYEIPGMELNANTLSIVRGAFQTSLDLEAHALGIDEIMPKLGSDDSE